MTSDETTAAEIIVAITASPSEESIICGTDSKQLYTGALSVADIQWIRPIRLVFMKFFQELGNRRFKNHEILIFAWLKSFLTSRFSDLQNVVGIQLEKMFGKTFRVNSAVGQN